MSATTLPDYIKSHSLTFWRKWPSESQSELRPWMPVFFIRRLPDDDSWKDGEFEVLANAERTHFVSINTTRQLFRIVHHELIPAMSDWASTRSNFVLQPI